MRGGRETLLLQQLIVLRVKTTHAPATADWHCNNKQSVLLPGSFIQSGLSGGSGKVKGGRSRSGCKYACATRHRNNRNRRAAPAALQIRGALNEEPRPLRPPHQRVPPMNNAGNIQHFQTICREESERLKPTCSEHDTSRRQWPDGDTVMSLVGDTN